MRFVWKNLYYKISLMLLHLPFVSNRNCEIKCDTALFFWSQQKVSLSYFLFSEPQDIPNHKTPTRNISQPVGQNMHFSSKDRSSLNKLGCMFAQSSTTEHGRCQKRYNMPKIRINRQSRNTESDSKFPWISEPYKLDPAAIIHTHRKFLWTSVKFSRIHIPLVDNKLKEGA